MAVGKPAWQSTTQSPDTAAAKATDGDVTPDLTRGSCAATLDGENGGSWLVVDLKREYTVREIAVVNRGDILGELNQFKEIVSPAVQRFNNLIYKLLID